MRYLLLFLLPLIAANAKCFVPDDGSCIINGVPWYDQDSNPVSAHGANIILENGRYWLFGEFKTDSANVFTGFSCYSSDDLCNWRFERIAFPQQQDGRMGPGRVGERPKVLKCPQTGEFVMLMHTDDLRYKDPCVCYATLKNCGWGIHLQRSPFIQR